jgi:hypothetical protein
MAQTEIPPIRYVGGVYAIRDDLFQYLIGEQPARRLSMLWRKLEFNPPRRSIPPHEPEF